VKFVEEIGRVLIFLFETFKSRASNPFRLSTQEELLQTVKRSFFTTCLTGVFVGGILALQIFAQVKPFGAESTLGGLAVSVTFRNIGPVLIAFVLAAKVGARIAAELASMRVSEQLDSLVCLKVNALNLFVWPKLFSTALASFLLLICVLFTSFVGALFISTAFLKVSSLTFLFSLPKYVQGVSILLSLVKSLCFGLALATVSAYQGYYASGGVMAVGNAVRKAMVRSLVTIVLLDFILTFFASSLMSVFL